MDDLISKQAAIDAIGRDPMGGLNYEFILRGMPTENRWIPCSERLPEPDKEVLISYRYREGEGDTNHTYIDITTYGYMYFGGRMVNGEKYWRPPFEYFSTNYEVIAWMPLPEPYEGRREVDEQAD